MFIFSFVDSHCCILSFIDKALSVEKEQQFIDEVTVIHLCQIPLQDVCF